MSLSPDDLDEWLDSWVEANLTVGDAPIEALADQCLIEAQAAGITQEALRRAVGGDLAAFLAEERDAIRESDTDF